MYVDVAHFFVFFILGKEMSTNIIVGHIMQFLHPLAIV